MMKNLFSLRKALVLFSAVLFGMVSVNAATITVSSAAEVEGVNYNTIQAAYDYIKGLGVIAPIEEAYTIEIQGTYAGEVAYPIVLNAIIGATDVNSITIKPATNAKITIAVPNQTIIASGMSFDATTTSLVLPNVTGLSSDSYVSGQGTYASGTFKKIESVDADSKTLTFSSGTFTATKTGVTLFFGAAQTQAVKFDGAKYVTIDGVSRTDENTGLTIANPNCIYAQTIYYTNAAQYNTVKNCIVRGANQTAAWSAGYNGTVFFNGGSYNSITMNDVCDMNDDITPMPICAFQVTGQGVNFENVISENNVYNISNYYAPNGNYGFFQFGSTNNTASFNNSILNNKVFWSKTTEMLSGTIVVIGTGGGMNGLGNRFEGNTIGYADANGNGKSIINTIGATLKIAATFKNFTCKNNTVANIEMTGTNFTGFEFGASNASSPNANDVCYGNTVENIKLMTAGAGTLCAFWINYANPFDMNIKNNVARNLTIENKTGDNVLKIYGFLSTGTYVTGKIHKFIGNEVSNLSSGLGTLPSTKAGDVYGIKINIVDLIEKNLIYNLNANPQAYIRGFRIEGNNPRPIVFQNNIMRLGTDVTGNANIIAIQSNSTSALNMYHNTVYLGGECASDASASVVTRLISYFTGSPTLSMQNNIFSNKRSGGASLNSVLLTSAGKVAVSDHNLYEYNGEYFNNATSYVDLSAWKIAMPLLEVASLDNAVPGFVDATGVTPDMHITSVNSPVNQSGVAIATVTEDYYGMLRADYSPADMGAIVISGNVAVETLKMSNLSVYAASNSIVFNNLIGRTANIYSLNGQLVKSVLLSSDKVSVPSINGCYIVKVGTENTKVLVK